jgi:hypothetical protein
MVCTTPSANCLRNAGKLNSRCRRFRGEGWGQSGLPFSEMAGDEGTSWPAALDGGIIRNMSWGSPPSAFVIVMLA